MKQTYFTLLSLCLAGTLMAQPIYLMYNSSCMDQLEYRYVYSGTSVVAYSVNPTANEQYILTTGSGGINAPSLPSNTVSCKDFKFTDQFLNEVNNVTKQVYIVLQQTRGYLLVPVISATQVIRSGTYYLYRAPNYSFAIDTSNLVYESNIATGSSTWYIYFNGLKIRGCYYEYGFKREPTKVSQERSEFDFIPGIGITSERTGMTAVEAENNQYRLIKVNNVALEDYITSKCQGRVATTNTPPLSTYTPQVTYGAGTDKETSSMPDYGPPPPNTGAGTGLPPLVSCPELPGEGYHIVQPGQTLNSISRAYDVSVKSLISWNKIKDPDLVQVCQKIWLRKPPTSTADVVYKGEPASKIPDGPVAQRQDMYWNSTANYAPAPYSLTQQPATTPYTPPAQPLVHTVQKGETLYGIAQRYNISEAEMRRLNNYPATGAVLLQPGMQLFVTDCCPSQTSTTTIQPVAPTNTSPYPNLNSKPAAYNHPYYQPQQPATTTNPNSGVLPDLYNTPTTTQPIAPATYSQPTTTGAQPQEPSTVKKPTYFQEYIVRQGDTINAVAIKFGVNAQELALVNNKEPNETLIAGQRLLIPRN